MRFSFILLFLFVLHLSGQDITLFDSVHKQNLNHWYRDIPAKVEYNADRRLKITFPKSGPNQYPAVYIRENNLPEDWSNISALVIKLETPTGGMFNIRFYGKDNKRFNVPVNLKPEKHTLRIPIAEFPVDMEHLLDIRFVADSPKADIILLVESITGEAEKNAHGSKKLFDFTRSTEGWSTRNAAIEKSNWPMDPTLNCAKIVFEKDSGYKHNPAVILKQPHLLRDWSNIDALSLEVESPTGGVFYLYFASPDGDKEHMFSLSKGEHKNLHFPESALPANRKNIMEFHLVGLRSQKDAILLIGDPVLEYYNAASKAAELNRRLAALEKVSTDSSVINAIAECRRKLKTSQTIKHLEKEVVQLEILAQKKILENARKNSPLLGVWTYSAVKVHREDFLFPALPTKDILIDCAQEESEGAQLILFPGKDLKNVSVTISGLPVNQNGKSISAENISIVPVGYIYCKKAPYYQERLGWWPDPLLTYAAAMNLEKDKFQPYFLDVRIPKGQESGIYRGQVTVQAEGLRKVFPFSIKVRNFSLDSQQAYPTMYSMPATLKHIPQCASNPEKWRKEAMTLALDHRMTPTDIYAGYPTSVEDAKFMLERGALCFNVIHCDVFKKHEEERIPMLVEAMKRYQEAGIADKAWLYGWDERAPEYLPRIAEFLRRIHENVPTLPVGTTTWDETFGNNMSVLKDMDYWIPTIDRYAMCQEQIAAARARGKKVWWYWAIGPHHPYPNIFIESNAIGTRLLTGMLAWKYQTDGALYYATIQWHLWDGFKKVSRLTNYLEGAPLTNWPGYSHTVHNGDGNLFYPAKQGLLCSLRMKHIRDGMDDYIALNMLSKAIRDAETGTVKMSSDWLEKAHNAVKIDKAVANSMVEWTANPEFIESKRECIYNLLESFQNTKSRRAK